MCNFDSFRFICSEAHIHNYILTIYCEDGKVMNNCIVCSAHTDSVIVRAEGTNDSRRKSVAYRSIRRLDSHKALCHLTDEELSDELKKRERKKNPTYYALFDSMKDRESPFVNVHMKNGVSYYQVYVIKIDYDTSNGHGSVCLRPETSDREIEVDINEISQICKDNLLPLMTEYVMHRDPRARQAVIRMIAEGKTEKSYYDD